jgi:hypothetical protein
MDGDSRCGLNAGRFEICEGGKGSPVADSGTIAAARAEKKPGPCSWTLVLSLSSELEGLLSREGDTGAEGGPVRLGWLRTRPATMG